MRPFPCTSFTPGCHQHHTVSGAHQLLVPRFTSPPTHGLKSACSHGRSTTVSRSDAIFMTFCLNSGPEGVLVSAPLIDAVSFILIYTGCASGSAQGCWCSTQAHAPRVPTPPGVLRRRHGCAAGVLRVRLQRHGAHPLRAHHGAAVRQLARGQRAGLSGGPAAGGLYCSRLAPQCAVCHLVGQRELSAAGVRVPSALQRTPGNHLSLSALTTVCLHSTLSTLLSTH